MIKISRFIVLLAVFLLTACQSTSSLDVGEKATSTSLFLDEDFVSDHLIESEEEIFSLSQEMKALISKKVLSYKKSDERAKALLTELFAVGSVGITYQSGANLTAKQAFRNKTANCMSLTIMAYALANEANLNIVFQDVQVPEFWVRNGEYNLLTGHVNLLVLPKPEPSSMVVWGNDALEIDFDPYVNKKSFPKKIINKNTVLAMFYNNKGADALLIKNYPLAYQYFKAASKADPEYATTWGNLGILYKFTQHDDYAKRAYKHSLSLDENNLNVLTNLAILLQSHGEIEQSKAIDSAIIKRRIRNPYYHALLADEALYSGQADRAIMFYKRAIDLDDNIHEFYFGLAKSYAFEGDLHLAQLSLKKAISLNKISSIGHQYIAKLDILKQETH